MMTPAKAGKALAAAMPNARTVVLRGAGHMMMVGAAGRVAGGAAGLTAPVYPAAATGGFATSTASLP